jgi:hypothetical protein
MSGGNHIAAGAVAALALPLGVFGLSLPFPAVILVAAVLYAGVALVLAPRRVAERIKPGQVGRVQAELVAGLIEEGEATVTRLREAARGLRSKDACTTTTHLADAAQGILDRLSGEPEKLPAVRRFLTYYLPRSAEIAEGLKIVEGQRRPDSKRQVEIEATLTRLDQAFTFYADSFAQAELDTLDVELKLIGRALADDLGPLKAEPVPVKRKGS